MGKKNSHFSWYYLQEENILFASFQRDMPDLGVTSPESRWIEKKLGKLGRIETEKVRNEKG